MDVDNAAKTYTLEDFIDMKDVDDATYRNFSVLEKYNGIEFVDHNLLDEYQDIVEQIGVKCELSDEEYKKYRYSPDLLAYDIYGSTQLDFIILAVNNMIDPKDFDQDVILLPYASVVKDLITEVLSNNREFLDENREYYGILD